MAGHRWTVEPCREVGCGPSGGVRFGKQLRDRKEFKRDVVEVKSLRAVPKGYRACYTGSDVQRYRVQWDGLACRSSRVAQRGGCWDDEKQDGENKLLTKQVGRFPDFGVDKLGDQCLNTIFMVNVTDEDLSPLFVLGCLNSIVVRAFWVDRFYDQRRTFPKIKGTYLKRLPIPSNVSAALQARVVELVEKRLALAIKLKVEKSGHRRTQIEREITMCEGLLDSTVLECYGLTKGDLPPLEAILRE